MSAAVNMPPLAVVEDPGAPVRVLRWGMGAVSRPID
jgi:hypothetical protein